MKVHVALPFQGPRSKFSTGGEGLKLRQTHKREPIRGVRGHAPPENFDLIPL